MNNFPSSLAFTLLALILVLLLAWFAIRMLSQLSSGKLGNGRIKLSHTLPLGAREKLVLIECDNTSYLLGVTSNGISLIDRKPANEHVVEQESTQPSVESTKPAL